jgi:hypothetical protein
MIDELVETILPGGAWLTAGIVIGAAFGTALRPTAVRVMAVGMAAAERLQEVGAEAYEKAQDMVAEARHERDHRRAAEAAPRTPPRRRPVRVESD